MNVECSRFLRKIWVLLFSLWFNSSYADQFLLSGGPRKLDSTDWRPVEDETFFGLSFHSQYNEQIDFVVSLQRSEKDESLFGVGEVEAEILDLGFGVAGVDRTKGHFRPSLQSGISLLRAESGSEEDVALGIHAVIQVLWRIGRGVFGVESKGLLSTDADIAGSDADMDYAQLGFVVGGEW